jgi:hypothetical protein
MTAIERYSVARRASPSDYVAGASHYEGWDNGYTVLCVGQRSSSCRIGTDEVILHLIVSGARNGDAR